MLPRDATGIQVFPKIRVLTVETLAQTLNLADFSVFLFWHFTSVVNLV